MEPVLGVIQYFGFNFAPRSFAMCNGDILPINQNQSLYSLLGTTYGGDGRTSFALPDLRGRYGVSPGNDPRTGLTVSWGQRLGAVEGRMVSANVPAHSHSGGVINLGGGFGTVPNATGNTLAATTGTLNIYTNQAPTDQATKPGSISIGSTGTATDPYPTVSPYLTVTACIVIRGLFPSRN